MGTFESCKNCKTRTIGCHATCSLYAKAVEENNAIKEKMRSFSNPRKELTVRAAKTKHVSLEALKREPIKRRGAYGSDFNNYND